ncbi:hypothetical protein A3A49_00690 [Candidatus Curtissbacteria bacterium RIFCSPLOWO2_01_FULL_38_11b]|uniref:Ribbon-helix-helix protein CopG domain-containing protein n=1 Tax=Candidatus Curtissbacteria bacterium RIFCSPLOWO2_01_FULL_38_11b TaxID=1797725 RepID=A0A1F5H3T4_9BACT|nr:MAG: hypothetical protein A3A49_00690 [Candidatus Curtissbacteria bacterium RIFCSPLOWO2_01_FULL_38_11b]
MTTITISLPKTTAKKVDEKTKEGGFATRSEFIRNLLRQYLTQEVEPPYGSDEWWKWSEKKADEDIKRGNVVKFDSVEDAIKWLNS